MESRFEKFTMLINRISRNIRKIKNEEMAEYHLRSAHVSCLYYLYIEEWLTATDLCERCEEDKATISRAIDYLETNGYLICESETAKKYKSRITLTDAGIEVGKKISKKINSALDEIGSKLSEEERDEFYRCLAIISEDLSIISSRYK